MSSHHPPEPRHVLMLRRCARCAHLLTPWAATCACGSTALEPVPSSGAGTIVSWKAVDCTPHEPTADRVESTIAVVRLDDGPWIYAWLDGSVPAESAGAVRVRFRPAEQGERFPVFGVCDAGCAADDDAGTDGGGATSLDTTPTDRMLAA